MAIFLLVVFLFPLVLLACSQDSASLGQYRQGRTLHFSVVSLERTPELRYATIDPEGVVRKWSLSAASDDKELVLVRARVENHTAISAIINVDRTAAQLRDFTNATYLPLSVTESVWQDFRGQPEALVRMDLGQCFDGTRALVSQGSSVKWQSEYDDNQYIAFPDSSVGIGAGGRADIGPGQSIAHTFSEAAEYEYSCGADGAPESLAGLRVVVPEVSNDYIDRSTLFIQGSFELQKGHGLDGYLVFEAPVGTEFRDIRWRAGDSITFRF